MSKEKMTQTAPCAVIALLAQSTSIRVTLLGTAGPSMALDRAEAGTLVQAGQETLLFDCGRGVPERLSQLGFANVSKIFLTHLHSDHTEGIPILWMSGWQGRGQNAFSVWGPATGVNQPTGTAGLGAMLTTAYATNTHIRRDLVEMYPAASIVFDAHEIAEGMVYQNNGVTVTAFLVNHDPVAPAFGYRIDYGGHSVVISGDTRPSDNLVAYAEGVDLLVHEVFNAAVGSTVATAAYHTLPEQAADVFNRVAPRLAVYSHLAPNAFDPMPRTRAAGYNGPLQVGADLTTITVGSNITFAPCASPDTPAITAVTNGTYGSTLSANGNLIVWGSGFSAAGGNSLVFNKATAGPGGGPGPGPGGGPGGGSAAVVLDETTGSYFWDSSTMQLNAALGNKLTPGAWTVSVKDACGVASTAFSIALQ